MERVDLVKSEYLMAIFKIPLFKSYSTFVAVIVKRDSANIL